MKAAVVEKLEGPDSLVIKEMEIPSPEAGKVLIDVKYAGVNFPDILITQGKYQFQPELPFAPGGEVAGIVEAVGEGVENLKTGDRVVSGTTWGGFAEKAIGFAPNTHLLPDEVSFKEGATILMTHGTVIHALMDRADLKEGETLVVLGASGGVGTAAIQIGKILGARVVAFTSSDMKADFCKKAGADEVHLYDSGAIKNTIKEVTGGKGANVIFDPVGGDYSEQAFRGIAPGGRHLVVGFAAGKVPSIPLNLPLLKSASIVGTFWGSFFRHNPEANNKHISQLLTWVKEEKLHPLVDQVFPLEKSIDALKRLQHRKVTGKVLIEI